MKYGYFIENGNFLCRVNYGENVSETWRIDEHSLACIYEKTQCKDVVESLNEMRETCHITYKEISEKAFHDLLEEFSRLDYICRLLQKQKLKYAENVKNYLSKF